MRRLSDSASPPARTGNPAAALQRHLLPAADRLADHLGAGAHRTALDIGTGNAPVPRRLLDREWRTIGVDLAGDALVLAQADGAGAFAEADARSLPFHDATFDAVISNFGIIFASPVSDALREARRVCRPGGRLALTTWVPDGWPDALRAHMADALGVHLEPFPTELGVSGTANEQLADTGWTVTAQEQLELHWDFESTAHALETLTTAAGGLRKLRGLAESEGRWDDLAVTAAAALAPQLHPAGSGVRLVDRYVLIGAVTDDQPSC